MSTDVDSGWRLNCNENSLGAHKSIFIFILLSNKEIEILELNSGLVNFSCLLHLNLIE